MAVATLAMARQGSDLFHAILVGGAVAGTLDLTSAFITFGPDNPRIIAAGLIGLQAVRSGIFPWILGVLLHYGIAVFLVMNLVVLPLCAFHYTGPFKLRGLLQGILAHIFLIGLPISFSLRRLSR